jgi:hypothetical protein
MSFDQSLFNVVVGFAGICGGWVLKTLWEAINTTQKNQRETEQQVSELKVLVAGHYVTRNEFNDTMNGIDTKLDYIVDALNKKQDRSHT